MNAFLRASQWIDRAHPEVTKRARLQQRSTWADTVQASFEFVRDQIRHTGDAKDGPITCLASDVLREQTGYCYAKAHLLVALLRANDIPAGMVYQRLTIDGDAAPYCLHGLAAVQMANHRWYRLDPRGNRDGINARFAPPTECLAFSHVLPGECLFPQVFAEPLEVIVDTLRQHHTWQDVMQHLPDVDPSQWGEVVHSATTSIVCD